MSLRVRKKKNKSGSISVIIVNRKNRGYKVIESLGSSKNEEEIEALYQKALKRIDELEPNLFTIKEKNEKEEELTKLLSQLTTKDFIPIGDELIFGKLFDDIGCKEIFAKIENRNIRKKEDKAFLFKSLVISRLLYAGSKLELINYLSYFKNIEIDENRIYRFLDTIYEEKIKSRIEKCIFNHTHKIMNNIITVTFYDRSKGKLVT